MGKVEISLSTLDLMLQIIKGVIDNSIPIGQLGAKIEYYFNEPIMLTEEQFKILSDYLGKCKMEVYGKEISKN